MFVPYKGFVSFSNSQVYVYATPSTFRSVRRNADTFDCMVAIVRRTAAQIV